MSVGIVDDFEVIQVKKQQVRGFHIQARNQKVIAGPVIGSRQFVVGGLEVKVRNAFPVDGIQIVVGVGQIPEFVGPGLPDGAVGLDLIHRVQDGVDALGCGQPHHEENRQDLEDDACPAQVQFVLETVQCFRLFCLDQVLHGLQAVFHFPADPVFLFIVSVVQHQLRSPLHFCFRGKGGVFGSQLYLFNLVRIVFDAFCFHHQAHGVVLPVHEFDGMPQRFLQPFHGSGGFGVQLHFIDGLFPSFGIKGFLKILVHVPAVAVYGKTLGIFRQVVRGFHQAVDGALQRDILV